MFEMMSAPTNAFAGFITIMVLTLVFFMMTVSFSQKIRELAWEQGVLRSIGLTKEQNDKIFFYEATCIVIASFIMGITSGLVTTTLISGLFSLIVSTSRTVLVPWAEIGVVIVIVMLATYLAVKIPADQLSKKTISSVLRGVDI